MATHIQMVTCMLHQRFGLRSTRIESIKNEHHSRGL